MGSGNPNPIRISVYGMSDDAWAKTKSDWGAKPCQERTILPDGLLEKFPLSERGAFDTDIKIKYQDIKCFVKAIFKMEEGPELEGILCAQLLVGVDSKPKRFRYPTFLGNLQQLSKIPEAVQRSMGITKLELLVEHDKLTLDIYYNRVYNMKDTMTAKYAEKLGGETRPLQSRPPFLAQIRCDETKGSNQGVERSPR